MKEIKMTSEKIATIERFDPTTLISGKLDWMPVSELRGPKSRTSAMITDKNGKNAIYQIALAKDINDIGDSLVNANIGYTGKSTNIFGRLYALKLNKHSASPYIKNTYDIKHVRIPVFFIADGDSLDTVEKYLHDGAEKKFGYRFAWKEASGGIDGTIMRIQDLIDRIESLDILKELSLYLDERAVDVFKSTWKQED